MKWAGEPVLAIVDYEGNHIQTVAEFDNGALFIVPFHETFDASKAGLEIDNQKLK